MSVALAKECVNKALELSLNEGIQFERRLFHSTFATVRSFPFGGLQSVVLTPIKERSKGRYESFREQEQA
jgi:hypothetical protein